MLEEHIDEIKDHMVDQCEHLCDISDSLREMTKAVKAVSDYIYNICVSLPNGIK